MLLTAQILIKAAIHDFENIDALKRGWPGPTGIRQGTQPKMHVDSASRCCHAAVFIKLKDGAEFREGEQLTQGPQSSFWICACPRQFLVATTGQIYDAAYGDPHVRTDVHALYSALDMDTPLLLDRCSEVGHVNATFWQS